MTLSFDQKFEILKYSTETFVPDKSTLLQKLAQQFPQLSIEAIELFLESIVDFDRLHQQQAQNEQPPSKSDETDDNLTVLISSPHRKSESESEDVVEKQLLEPPPPRPRSTPSPPLVVPVKTPSGRTLRSNSTVNTSEPRKLRSSK